VSWRRSLAEIASQTPYGFVWEICAADFVALKNHFGKHALQQLTEAMERIATGATTASTSLADEIDRLILASVKPDYKPAISLWKGWDGG
jgi:hypothetical protein